MKQIKLCMVVLCCLVASMAYATCSPINVSYLTSTSGDIAPMTTDDSQVWSWYANYTCGYGTAFNKNKEVGYQAHLFTPALDLSEAKNVTITFQHAHKFGETSAVQTDYTLWVTKDYKGSYAASTWQQLTIPTYGTNTNWTYVNASITVPTSYVGSNTVFAFTYNNGSTTGTWQVKNVNITTTCADGTIVAPVPLPSLGDGRLKIFAQNLRNYYYHYNIEGSSRATYTEAEFIEKTRKIVNAMMMVNADIYALCEVEAQPIVLAQLADSMNARVEGEPFAAVTDGIDVAWDSYDNNIKSGFIYRKDKVFPYGSNYAAYNAQYYRNTMRIQAFEEKASHERFTLAMNHFKAKDSSSDKGNATREQNANNLLSGLNNYAADPDILILGDLNCTVDESPITIIQNAGYEEQILKYESDPYSHCYSGTAELIDHAFANSTMANYITGAGVFHISTSCGSYSSANAAYRYSDHDPYVVAFNLPMKQPGECEDIDVTHLTSELGECSTDNSNVWYWNSYNYAKGSKQGGATGHLFTPGYDMTNMQSVTLSFSHAHRFEVNASEEYTLWVTKDFQGSFEASTWQQLTIDPYSPYANNKWNWGDVNINVPTAYVGANTVFAFQYKSTASNYGTWEIKNLHIQASCSGGSAQDVEEVPTGQKALKTIKNGQLILVLPDGSKYNATGMKIQ